MKKSLKVIGRILLGAFLTSTVVSHLFYNIAFRRKQKRELPTESLEKLREEREAKRESKREEERKLHKTPQQLEWDQLFDESIRWFEEQESTKVSIQSFDGLKLVGHYLPCEDAKRTVICVHGYRGTGIHDFAYIAKFYHQNNCNLLLIDQRGHGESEGNYVDMGVKARYDVLHWAEYVEEKLSKPSKTSDFNSWNSQNSLRDSQEPDVRGEEHAVLPIYLDGVSMGAATVLMASGLNLPASVRGIIADSGYSSPWEEVKYACREKFHVPEFVAYFLEFQCRIRAGYSLKEISPKEAVKNCKVPVLFVHGSEDHFVPTQMSQINYDACGEVDKQIEIVEGATHAMSYMVDTKRCNETIMKFFEKND